MEASVSSETLVPIYKTTWPHILEDNNLQIHCGENLSSGNSPFGDPQVMCGAHKQDMGKLMHAFLQLSVGNAPEIFLIITFH
jgi:hypothetical protein